MERSIAAALLDFQSSSYFSNTTANHSTNSADSKSRTSAISSAKTSSTQAKYCYRNNDRTSSKEGKVSAFTSSTASMGITKSVVKDLKFPIKVNSIRDKMTEFFLFSCCRGINSHCGHRLFPPALLVHTPISSS